MTVSQDQVTMKPLDENKVNIDSRFSVFNRLLRFDVTLVIAVAVGLFTLNGYAYLEKYYSTLEVPITRINISAQMLLSYGGASIGSQVFAFAFAAALVASLTVLMALTEKPGRKVAAAPELKGIPARVRDRAKEIKVPFKIVGGIILIAFISYTFWHGALEQPSQSGRKSALNEVRDCVEQTLFFQDKTEYRGCVVAESDDMLYLVKRLDAEKGEVNFKAFRLPKVGLARTESTIISLKLEKQ